MNEKPVRYSAKRLKELGQLTNSQAFAGEAQRLMAHENKQAVWPVPLAEWKVKELIKDKSDSTFVFGVEFFDAHELRNHGFSAIPKVVVIQLIDWADETETGVTIFSQTNDGVRVTTLTSHNGVSPNEWVAEALFMMGRANCDSSCEKQFTHIKTSVMFKNDTGPERIRV